MDTDEMMKEIKEYQRLIQGFLAYRAKYQPTIATNFDPLVDVLTKLTMWQRAGDNGTFEAWFEVIQMASKTVDDWIDQRGFWHFLATYEQKETA